MPNKNDEPPIIVEDNEPESAIEIGIGIFGFIVKLVAIVLLVIGLFIGLLVLAMSGLRL